MTPATITLEVPAVGALDARFHRARMWASLAAAFAAVAIADADFGREDAAAASMRKAASYAHLAQREGWRPEFDFEQPERAA